MSVPRVGREGKREERPAGCRVCGSPAWWNGRRWVATVVTGVCGAVTYVAERVRLRARCSDRRCAGGSWTVYADGDYPQRTFQLDVVASATVQAALESRRAAEEAHLCSRRSVARWMRWCAGLADSDDLARLVVRLDADGLPLPAHAKVGSLAARASAAVSLWERLAAVLASRGVVLPSGRCGLQRLLCWQRESHGVVAWLTKPSPRLPVESWVAVM